MDRNELQESGLLELYAMGLLTIPDIDVVSEAVSKDPLIARELSRIEEALFLYAQSNAITPNPTIKPLLLAKIDYRERIKQGEIPERVPVLNEDSKVVDFDRWLQRGDMQLHPDFDGAQITIIADEADTMTAIVWLGHGAPPETHTAEHEKFLIVEGTCDLTIGTEVYHLKPEDYLAIPLHLSHHLIITSTVPCKFILQRMKA